MENTPRLVIDREIFTGLSLRDLERADIPRLSAAELEALRSHASHNYKRLSAKRGKHKAVARLMSLIARCDAEQTRRQAANETEYALGMSEALFSQEAAE